MRCSTTNEGNLSALRVKIKVWLSLCSVPIACPVTEPLGQRLYAFMHLAAGTWLADKVVAEYLLQSW